MIVNEAGVVVMANRVAEHLFGYDADALLGQSVEMLVPDELRRQHAARRAGFAERPAARPMGNRRDLQGRRRDGKVMPVEVGLSPVQVEGESWVVCTIVDLTERKRAEERIAQQAAQLQEANARLAELASTDGLTSLWNRRSFLDQMDIQLEQAVRRARPLSVLILDLDYFKAYNDGFGHLAGDEVLVGAARVLREVARRSDYVARIGGEEFGIILPEADREGAVALGERFRGAIQAASWPRRDVTVSVGAATVAFAAAIPRPTPPSRSEVLSAADRALYRSKARGRNCVTHVDDPDAGTSESR